MEVITLHSPFSISLISIVNSHGWVNLAPWSWDSKKGVLSRLEHVANSGMFTMEVSQDTSNTIKVKISGAKIPALVKQRALTVAQRWVSFDWDPTSAIETAEKIDRRISDFISLGGGRFLRSSTFYEDFVKTVCTINTNWSSTKRMVSDLVSKIGAGAFPTPSMVKQCGESFLRSDVRLGFRASVVSNSTTELLDKHLIDIHGDLIHDGLSYDDLIAIKGIGPYSASHIAMLEHDFSRIPVDSEVISYFKEHLLVDPRTENSLFDTWGRYRFLGYKLHRILNRENIID